MAFDPDAFLSNEIDTTGAFDPEEFLSTTPVDPGRAIEQEKETRKIRLGIAEVEPKSLVTAAQLGASLTPFSPATEFTGEFIKSVIDDEGISSAIKKGATAATIDLGIRLAAGGLPSSVIKAGSKLSPKIANALSESVLANKGLVGKAGEALTKLKLPQPKFREEVVDMALNDPDLLVPTKQTFDSISKTAVNSINEVKKSLGEIVSAAKKEAGLLKVTLNTKPLLSKVQSIKKELGFIERAGKVTRKDPEGLKAIKVFRDELKGAEPQSAERAVGFIGFRAPKKLAPKIQNTIENLQIKLENIDISKEYQEIFEKMITPGKSLTPGQKAALELRRDLRDLINDSVEDLFNKTNLKEAKTAYFEIANSLDQFELKTALKNADKLSTALKQSLKEGKSELFNALKRIDDILPKDQQFLRPTIKKELGREIETLGLDRLLNFNLRQPVLGLAGRAGRRLLKRGTAGKKVAGALVRRSAVEIGSELKKEEK